MKRKLRSLLALALSAMMLVAILPSSMAAGTDIVKDHMDWPNWSEAGYFEGTVYNMGTLGDYNSWSGYVPRTGGNAKHWISDASLNDGNHINATIYGTRGNTTTLKDAPTRGGAFGYVGHNYGKFQKISDKSKVPEDKWMGVKDISAYKDNGYLVFKVDAKPANYDNAYFCITAVADQYGMYPFEATGTQLPITKATHGEYTTWKDHRMTAINGVKVSDYYNSTGAQMVAIPLKKLIDDPDFQEFAGAYCSDPDKTIVNNLDDLYADANYKMDLRLYSGAGVAKREANKGERLEMRLTASEGFKIVALEAPTKLSASVSDNKVTLSWTKTGDEGITYRVARTFGGKTEYLDAGTDTNYIDKVESNGIYTYAVEAYSSTYKVPSLPSNSVQAEVAVAGGIQGDSDKLLIEDWKIAGIGNSNTAERAKPWPFFMGDFYVSSSKTVAPYRFSWSNTYEHHTGSDYQRWFINDSGYDPNNKGAEITYRPKKAGEYFLERDGVQYDAYIPFYVGYVAKGDYGYNEGGDGYVPKEWILDKWGFNGFRYANNKLENNRRDISEYLDTGYFVYTINVPKEMNTEGVYLAITTSSGGWNDGNTETPFGQIAIGVPLEDYYDVNEGGWQTIKIPLKKFEFAKTTLEKDNIFLGSYHGSEWIGFTDYDNWRKYNGTDWQKFTGMGIVRNDVDDSKVEGFYIDVRNLAIVNDVIETPDLTAEFIPASECIALEWSETGYSDTKYTIIKSDGVMEEEIEVGQETIYVDREIDDGAYTYKVKATVGKYELTRTSTKAEVQVTGLGGGDIGQGGDDVDKTVNPAKLSFPVTGYESTLSPTAYYRGPNRGWQGFNATDVWANDGYSILLTDNNGDATIDKSEINPEISGELGDGSPAGTKNWGKTNWAYEGFKLNYQWTKGDATSISEVPDEYWANVYNAEPINDTAYAVYEIEVGKNNTAKDGVYLGLTTAFLDWTIAGYDGTKIPFTKEAHPNIKSDTHYATTVLGLPLADYYDFAKGGKQLIAVPLREFANYAFIDMYAKAWGKNHYDKHLADMKYDPRLISGMGIIKEDLDDSKVTTVDIKVGCLEIVDVQTPTNFEATTENGVVTLKWDGTSDKGVTYNVVKSVNGVKKYLNAGQKTYYNDTDVEDGVSYEYSVVAVYTNKVGRILSPETDSVLISSEGAETVEKVDVVLVDYQPYTYNTFTSPAAYYMGNNNGWNDYETSWAWKNGGYYVKIDDNNGDATIDKTEINATVAGLASYGSSDGIKNWGSSDWAHDGFRFQAYWNNEEEAAAVPDFRWGNMVDISAGKDSAYALFEIDMKGTTATEGMYLAVSTVLDTKYLYGFNESKGFPINKENQPGMKNTQHGAAAMFGVDISKYYDFAKGGYQTMLIPITEFSKNADFVDVFGKSGFGADDYDADAIKFIPEMLNSMGVIKLDTDKSTVTTMEAYLKNMKILNVAAPKKVNAALDGVNVVLSWPASATNDATTYKIYRNGEVIGTTTKTYYIDDENVGTGNKYSVTAVHKGYGIESAHTHTGAVKVPTGTVKLYEGTGAAKIETMYVTEGAMTVSGLSTEEGNTLYVARYNKAGRLIAAYIEPLAVNEWKDVKINVEDDEEIIKGFIWNSTTFEPATDTYMFKRLGIKSYLITYPTFGTKAVTFNINDGADTDAAVIELMHKYGINATFGLTDATENFEIYNHEDFEIANHTTHIEMYLDEEYVDDNGNTVTPPTYDDCVASVEAAEEAITQGSGVTPSGLVWPYMAPEEREIFNKLKLYAGTNNYKYIRDSQVTGSYELPADWNDWGISAWVQKDNTESIMTLVDKYKNLNTNLFKILSIAGNGSDMSEEELLAFYEDLFKAVSNDEIWKATNIEVCEYIQATNKLEITKDYIYNPTDVTLYMIVNGGEWVAEPKSYAHQIEE